MVVSITESTYPVQEPLSVNFLLMLGQISTAGGSYLGFAPGTQSLFSKIQVVGNWGFMAGVALVVPGWLYAMTCFKTKSKLTEVEEGHREIDEEDAVSIMALRFESTRDFTKTKVFQSMLHKNPSFAERLTGPTVKSFKY